MRINKKSWHYRLIAWSNYNVPKSLCPYFWTMNWCIITAVPRAIFGRIGDSLYKMGQRSDNRNEELYKEMSDMQAFKIMIGKYSLDELTTSNYNTWNLPHSVGIWWSSQGIKDRNPSQIIRELAVSYEQGKIVFRSLSIKRAILQVLVSYALYLYWGLALICIDLAFTFFTTVYWELGATSYSIEGCIVFGGVLSIVLGVVVFGAIYAIANTDNWWSNIKKKYYVPREDDIVGAMIKSTHRKACPILEFHS